MFLKDHPRLSEAHLSLAVTMIALFVTILFHFFLARTPFGPSLVLFSLSIIIGTILVPKLCSSKGNRWAYLFLLPATTAMVAELLYSSDAVRGLAPMVLIVSLALFGYWYPSPILSYRAVRVFWPLSFFLESIIPARRMKGYFDNLHNIQEGKRIATGAILAVPFLLVIGALFVSSDLLIQQSLQELLVSDTYERFFYLLRDAIVFGWMTRVGWSMVLRVREDKPHAPVEHHLWGDPLIIETFLWLLNVLFLGFVAFQFAYFFGGSDLIHAQGYTYAEYARRGFFELLAVSGIVFAIVSFLFFATEFRAKRIRLLASALILETGIIMISAIRRLMLYIDAYGLTVSRWWAAAFMVVIAIVLGVIFVGAWVRASYPQIGKVLFLAILGSFSILLLVNVEGYVARWNIDRFFEDRSRELDIAYLTSLSSDSLQELVRWRILAGPTADGMMDAFCLERIARIDHETPLFAVSPRDPEACRIQGFRLRERYLQSLSEDWRRWTWSDHRGLIAISRLRTR